MLPYFYRDFTTPLTKEADYLLFFDKLYFDRENFQKWTGEDDNAPGIYICTEKFDCIAIGSLEMKLRSNKRNV